MSGQMCKLRDMQTLHHRKLKNALPLNDDDIGGDRRVHGYVYHCGYITSTKTLPTMLPMPMGNTWKPTNASFHSYHSFVAKVNE